MTELYTDAKRALVVEDEPAISEVCRRVITAEGIKAEIAINGEVALDMIEEKHYDLCLIDIRTPLMNGKELYLWMEEKHPQLTNGVIFTTGDMMDDDTKDFLEQADKLFLPKPFAPNELRIVLREALKQIEKPLSL
ncbi:response regulator [Chloroflexota bacterium]